MTGAAGRPRPPRLSAQARDRLCSRHAALRAQRSTRQTHEGPLTSAGNRETCLSLAKADTQPCSFSTEKRGALPPDRELGIMSTPRGKRETILRDERVLRRGGQRTPVPWGRLTRVPKPFPFSPRRAGDPSWPPQGWMRHRPRAGGSGLHALSRRTPHSSSSKDLGGGGRGATDGGSQSLSHGFKWCLRARAHARPSSGGQASLHCVRSL